MGRKAARQAELLRLANRRRLSSQEEMVRLLQQSGIHATQSSVSRDVRELGLVRVDGRYVPAQRLGLDAREASDASPANELITSTTPIGANLVVLRTDAGNANAVAIEIDRRQLPDVAGTLAGDDTIFIAVRSRSAQGRVLALLGRRGDHRTN